MLSHILCARFSFSFRFLAFSCWTLLLSVSNCLVLVAWDGLEPAAATTSGEPAFALFFLFFLAFFLFCSPAAVEVVAAVAEAGSSGGVATGVAAAAATLESGEWEASFLFFLFRFLSFFTLAWSAVAAAGSGWGATATGGDFSCLA
uniref:(northern house mosquito) hypothetical protein n=1 Tax=Culex pipiens TaxID=7175 RepID=A0A8D8BN57_CULPI